MIDDFTDQLYTIDFDTAALNLVGSTNAVRLASLAIVVIPEPNTALLLSLGLVGMAAKRNRLN